MRSFDVIGHSRGGFTGISLATQVSGALSYMRAAGAITSWDGFSDSYFEWEPEPVETVRLTGTAVHLVYLAPEHSIPGSPDGGTDVEIDEQHVRNLQEYLARAIASGVKARGEIVAATHYGRSEAIMERAKAVKADLVILNTEVGGQKAKAKLAEKIVAHNDKMAVLIARSTAALEQPNSG